MNSEFENLIEFSRSFDYDHDNDREIVIVGCAYIEYLVKEILESTFVDDLDESNRLLNESTGALSSLVPRARLLYLLGVISQTVYKDIQIIGKIRNEFAHKISTSFDDNKVKQLCDNLKWHVESLFREPPPGVSARQLYQVGVNQIVSHLGALPGLQRCKRARDN